MFEGGYRNNEKITVPNIGCGVVIMPEPVYKYPKDHPIYVCVFIFRISKPSCMSGGCPDTKNCINAFYKKIQARQRLEYAKRLKQNESEK